MDCFSKVVFIKVFTLNYIFHSEVLWNISAYSAYFPTYVSRLDWERVNSFVFQQGRDIKFQQGRESVSFSQSVTDKRRLWSDLGPIKKVCCHLYLLLSKGTMSSRTRKEEPGGKFRKLTLEKPPFCTIQTFTWSGKGFKGGVIKVFPTDYSIREGQMIMVHHDSMKKSKFLFHAYKVCWKSFFGGMSKWLQCCIWG